MHSNRRQFIGMLAGCAALKGSNLRADQILFNATFLTMDPSNPRAEAVAISGDRFLAVDSKREIENLATPSTRRVDLGGATVTPGFIDAHLHFASSGLRHLKEVDCDLRSIATIKDAIHARSLRAAPGEWIVGFKYDDTKTSDGRPLSIQDLTEAAPNNPVIVTHRGGHTSWVNRPALDAADVNDKTPDPAGGKFERGSDGKLTGRAMETANAPFQAKIPSVSTRAERQAGVKLMSDKVLKAGITSVNDPHGSPRDLIAYEDTHAAGELGVRVYGFISQPLINQMLPSGARTGLGNEWVRIGAMKMVADGSISERDAWMTEPYVGRPGDYGIQVKTEEQLYQDAREPYAAGWQIATHANGDAAIDMVLRVYARLYQELPRSDPRFRIEHCTLINNDLVRRIKAQAVIPTPFSSYVYYHGEKMKAYGQERLNRMFALRSFIDSEIPCTMSSDYPPGPYEPMMFLQSAVTRTDIHGNVWGPKQKITVAEALRVATINGAYASFEEKSKGSIEPGKLADLTVLGRDPFATDSSELVSIPILRTMTGGVWRFEA